MATAQLALLIDNVVVKTFQLDKPIMTIGRSASCDILIDDDSVSSIHAAVHVKRNDYLEGHEEVYLEDLNSRNGTFVNDRKITKCRLYGNDIITIAWTRFKMLCTDPKGGETTVLIMRD